MPDRYGVMGHPISHSRSPFIHNRFARQTGEAVLYEAIHVMPGMLASAIADFRASGGRGLNITLPFKEEAYRLVEVRTGRAERARAVNTIWFDSDETVHGDNTDGVGLVRDLTENREMPPAGRRVLLLGAGGAARGVVGPLLDAGVDTLVIANRTRARAEELVQLFGTDWPTVALGLDELEGGHFELIVNATSASLRGARLGIPCSALAPSGWCYDLAYGVEPTPFVAWGRACGASRCVDGLGMLVEQAAESFYRWRGVRPETASIIAALRAGEDADS